MLTTYVSHFPHWGQKPTSPLPGLACLGLPGPACLDMPGSLDMSAWTDSLDAGIQTLEFNVDNACFALPTMGQKHTSLNAWARLSGLARTCMP